jgi:NAD-dependent deacetylase
VKATPEEAALHMVGKKKFMILTGAGLSAASGIPTFRGQEGFWQTRKNYGGEVNPEALLMTSFFEEKPEAVWEWHYDFIDLCKDKHANIGHKVIREF